MNKIQSDQSKNTSRLWALIVSISLLWAPGVSAYTLGLGIGGVSERTQIDGENQYTNGANLGLSIHFKLWDHEDFPSKKDAEEASVMDRGPKLDLSLTEYDSANILIGVAIAAFVLYGGFYALAMIFAYQLEFGVIANADYQQLNDTSDYKLASFGMGFRMFPVEEIPFYFGAYYSNIKSISKNLDEKLIYEEDGFQRRAVAGFMSYDREGPFLEFSWEKNVFEKPDLELIPQSISAVLPVGNDRKSAKIGYSFKID